MQVKRFVRPGRAADNQAVVGVSISLEKLVQAALEDRAFETQRENTVFVCCSGKKSLEKDKLLLVKDLLAHDICAQLWQSNTPVGYSTSGVNKQYDNIVLALRFFSFFSGGAESSSY